MGLFAALGVWEPTRRGCGAMMVRIGLWPLNILAQGLLGGSWVVIRGVISRVTIIITHITGFISPRIIAHEPPSKP